jgi:hypothetical protein
METFRVKITNDLYVEVIYQMLKALDFIEIQREQPQAVRELSAGDLLGIPIADRKAYLAMEAEKALSFYVEDGAWKESQGMELIDY